MINPKIEEEWDIIFALQEKGCGYSATYEAQVWDPRLCGGPLDNTFWVLISPCPEGCTSSPPPSIPTNPPPCNPDYNGNPIASQVACCEGQVQVECTGTCCQCGGVTCEPSETCCDNVCVDLTTDHDHCGDCNIVCEPSEKCCLGNCKDVTSDENNCGDCGFPCDIGFTCCSGVCKELFSNDPLNCGACGNNCLVGEVCVNGVCKQACSIHECSWTWNEPVDDPCTDADCGVQNWKWTYGTILTGNNIFSGASWALASDCNPDGIDYICTGTDTSPPYPSLGSCNGAFDAFFDWICNDPDSVPGVNCQNSGPHEISGTGPCFDVDCNCEPASGCCVTYGLTTTEYAYTEIDLSLRTVAVITSANPTSEDCTAGTPGDPDGWSVFVGECPCYGCGFSTWEYMGGGIWNMLSDCSGSPSILGRVCETDLDAGYFFSYPYTGLRVSLQCSCQFPAIRALAGSWEQTSFCPEGCVCPEEAPVEDGTVDGQVVSYECVDCSPPCLEGQTCCNNACKNLSNDPNNCGACGNICPAGQSCCSGSCKDLSSDSLNCGSCGNQCPIGQTCYQGICQVCNPPCEPPLTCCEGEGFATGYCVDTSSDNYNCGECGLVCPSGYSCVNSSCLPCEPPCLEQGKKCCSNQCIDIWYDENNCGDCGVFCNKTCCQGYCKDTQTDQDNCGSCGNACGLGETCCLGVCVDLQTDSNNCGECGLVCPEPPGDTFTVPKCSSGACAGPLCECQGYEAGMPPQPGPHDVAFVASCVGNTVSCDGPCYFDAVDGVWIVHEEDGSAFYGTCGHEPDYTYCADDRISCVDDKLACVGDIYYCVQDIE